MKPVVDCTGHRRGSSCSYLYWVHLLHGLMATTVPPSPTALHQQTCGMRQTTGTSSCDEAEAKLGSLSEPQNHGAKHNPGSYEADRSDSDSDYTPLDESGLVWKVAATKEKAAKP